MIPSLCDAWSDVAWAGGFVRDHVLLLLTLGIVPATARVLAALEPAWTILGSGLVEALIGTGRMLSLAIVVTLAWRQESAPMESAPSWSTVTRTLGRYLGRDWERFLLGLLIAAVLLAALSVCLGLVAHAVGMAAGNERVGLATSFGLRNLITITLTYPVIYALARPALLGT